MVTSNKQTDKNVVKMTTQNNTAVVPHRTLLGEVNEHITCPLCRGYYIDATTIVECLHSFCRSCIIKHLQVKKYCPVCEMMINSAKPNIKLDKALQDIVYKLVPGLFQKEMERRQTFYASRPGPAASATPEQRGEDTERIIFSPEDVISFSLEFSDVTDNDSISSKSSDSNEPQLPTTVRRYLQCPAVVNISHLKKFLSMKFDIDSTQFAIDILYKRVPLPDYYTLMDIAYIYNWKRNEPMRFFYQIIDYVAIRNRLFDNNRKSTPVLDKKQVSTVPENAATAHLNDQASEASSGTDSPMPGDSILKKGVEIAKKEYQIENSQANTESVMDKRSNSPSKNSDDEDKKSQFLNSFELTAKSNAKSPPKSNSDNITGTETVSKFPTTPKVEDSLKRKYQSSVNVPELKKVKIELEKAKIPGPSSNNLSPKSGKPDEKIARNVDLTVPLERGKTTEIAKQSIQSPTGAVTSTISRDNKLHPISLDKQPESAGQKRTISEGQVNLTPKRKPEHIPSLQKTVSPLKIQLSKTEPPTLISNKTPDTPKITKKIPDLKPSTPSTLGNKTANSGKLRMDLLANNSDPTIDRSKILSQVKTSASSGVQNTGDNLKSLFDSCKINIPSSLSITLTDQKSPSDLPTIEQKKALINKNLANANNLTGHKVPSPPVHNYIEIKKLPDTEAKKVIKSDGPFDSKPSLTKTDTSNQSKALKPNETSSAKGPIPNLKPIADTKLAKQSVALGSSPITFQQTFEQQLQSLTSDSKNKVPKNKFQVPKLVPATPKTLSAANKLSNSNTKAPTTGSTGLNSGEIKSTTALDLSTPHTIQSQLGPQQTKAFETMQSIANLAKKQNLPPKTAPIQISQNIFPSLSRPANVASSVRVPPGSSSNQVKQEKSLTNITPNITNLRPDIPKQMNTIKQLNQSHNNPPTNVPSPNYQGSQPSSSSMQPSPRSQTRSPSSSPKLVIAEEKHTNNLLEQSSHVAISSQLSSMFAPKSESHKDMQNIAKPGLKPLKPLVPPAKISGIRQPITPTLNANTPMSSQADYLSQPLLSQALFRHQMDMQHAWLKAQRQFDLYKNMPNMAHQNQNDFNNKDNKNV